MNSLSSLLKESFSTGCSKAAMYEGDVGSMETYDI
jgi:hypothetical protein